MIRDYSALTILHLVNDFNVLHQPYNNNNNNNNNNTSGLRVAILKSRLGRHGTLSADIPLS